MDERMLLLLLLGLLFLAGIVVTRIALKQARAPLRWVLLFVGISLIHAAACLPVFLVCYACKMSPGGDRLGEIIGWTTYFPILLLDLLGLIDSTMKLDTPEAIAINSPIWAMVFLFLVHNVRQLMTLFRA